ncbi:hypothetical protein CA267_002310 [Alteromonas pelagimontana]|uniref:Uncharacterized protein n=1 Tax=Alteromonas pelagimontana TaxID=1858656 RepID=A0A6M4M951_9ALTE|nr:hypothetical protein [Alteromonas pelagimontana]QJR79711.1 hypothetical protein CA267_002310 [Alteromonas pelagimontana]
MEVLILLGILFLALIIVIPLLERSKLRVSSETASKISRWIWPLIMIMLVLQLIMMMFRG